MAHLLTIKQNQIKMIKARGYDVSHDEWMLDVTFKQLKKKLIKKHGEYQIRKLLFSEYIKEHANVKPLFVYYIGLQEGKQIKLEAIDPFIAKMVEEDKDGLLIINSVLSPSALRRLNMITESKYQIFQEHDFDFDLINHIMVPKHELMSPLEVANFKKRTMILPKGLPIIPHTDAIVKYYNFPIGSFIKLTTESDIDIIYDEMYEYCIVI